MTKLNRKKKAYHLLRKLNDRQLILFQDLFNIYRARELLEEIIYESNEENEFYYLDMLNIVQYKKYIRDFKNMLFKISSLYLKFWTLLLNSHNQIENLENLNNIGKEIKDLLSIIDESFNKIYNYRNDVKIIKLYINFIKKVLVDKRLYEKYYKNLINNSLDFKRFNKEDEYSSYDINKLKETDEHQWILVSAGEKNYGTILNMSLGICPIIGYKRREIVGSNINVLIPNIFHKHHNHMLHKLLFNTRYQFFESLSKKKEYKPDEIREIVYCKNKSKYLIPFPFRAFFVQTEEAEHIFVMNIIKPKCFPHSKNKKNEKPLCCVLTDRHFIIQTFTPNAYDYLGLNSSDIDSGINISSCISKFGNEIFHNINEKDNTLEMNDIFNYSSELNLETSKSFHNANTLKSEKKLKRDLTRKDYFSPRIISWKYNKNSNNNKNNNNNLKIYSRLSSDKYEIRINKNDTFYEKKLLLQIEESKINNVLLGYKFYFKKIEKEKKDFLLSLNNIKTNNFEQSEFLESGFSEELNINNYDINILNSPNQTLKSNRRDSIKKYDSSLNVYNSDKPVINTKRRSSQGTCHQKLNINNFVFSFKVDMYFLPVNKCNFIFDLDSKSYIYHDKIKNQNSEYLQNILLQQAKEKISLLKINESKNHNNSNSDKNELISDSNSNSNDSSSSYSDSNSNYESSNYESSSITNNKVKFYKSFISQKDQKSTEGGKRMSKFKNKTSKTQLKKSIPDQPLYDKITSQLREKSNINMSIKFYEVNMKHILLLRYDFYKETILQDTHFEKISKVNEVINELKNNNDILVNKDDNYPFININHFITMKKKNNTKTETTTTEKMKKKESKKKLDINKIIFNKNQLQYYKKSEKEKKIDEALNKKDKQHSIINFSIISVFCLLVLYAIGGVNLYIYLKEVSRDKENVKLVCDSTDLKFYFNSALYFIRELTLLYIKNNTKISNGEYTGYASFNKTNYITNLINKVLDIYSNIHNLNEVIIATELPLSENTTYYLNDKEYFFDVLGNDYEIKTLRTSLSNGIIVLDAYLYNLAELNSIIEQSNEDVYPFIHNILNSVGDLLNIQIELYMNEITLRGTRNKRKVIISHGIVFVILIFIFIIISKAYNSVLKNKANYFYIFYGIKIEIIHELINNCESFLQKLKKFQKVLSDENEEEKNEENEEESVINPKLNYMLRSVISSNNELNYNILSNRRKGSIRKLILNKKDKTEKNEGINYKFSIKLFNYCFIFFCLMILAYFCLIINNYLTFIRLIYEYTLYNYHLQNYHNSLIEVINAYREFLFDDNTIINGTKANDFIDSKINDIYSSKFYDNIILNKYRKKIPEFLEKYEDFHSKTLCSRRNQAYFSSEEECQEHMQGISNYGFSVVHTSVTEEIRMYKNMVNQLLTNESVIGNLTLYGSKYWSDEEIENELKSKIHLRVYYRVYLFNNNSFHKDINVLFNNVIYPYIDTERALTIDSIINAIENKEKTYILYFGGLLVAFTLLFLIYWVPMIKNLNISIYKTKKMLSIIPLHILASQTNINALLNLGTDSKSNDNNT